MEQQKVEHIPNKDSPSTGCPSDKKFPEIIDDWQFQIVSGEESISLVSNSPN